MLQSNIKELGKLIQEERQAYNEEREKFEVELDSAQKKQEIKYKLIKSKIASILDIQENFINAQRY